MNRNFSRAGFTLVELLVVIAMLTILAGALSSAIVSAMRQAKIAKATTEVREITNAILAYENATENHVLKPLNDDASASSLGFLLDGSESGANGKNIPVLYNAALRGGKIYDPWGLPYRVLIQKGANVKIEDNVLDNVTTATFIPNYYRLNGEEEGGTK